jgi:hypothetical protein
MYSIRFIRSIDGFAEQEVKYVDLACSIRFIRSIHGFAAQEVKYVSLEAEMAIRNTISLRVILNSRISC